MSSLHPRITSKVARAQNDSPGTPDQERQEAATAQHLAGVIRATGMAGPALVALHLFKPLSWLGGQMLWVLQPLLGGSIAQGSKRPLAAARMAAFLEKEENIDDLVKQLRDDPSEAV